MVRWWALLMVQPGGSIFAMSLYITSTTTISGKIDPTGQLAVSPSARKHKGEIMARILLLGLDPETVDFSDPALPPGMTAEKVRAGIAVALRQFTEHGW